MQETEKGQNTERYAKRKSIVLSDEEYRGLKKYIKGFNTLTEAAESLGISRQRLDRIQLVGSGSPDSISIIREKLNTAA